MHLLRALLLRHRVLTAFVVAAALCLKVLVPSGYMLDSGSTSITVRLCDDGMGSPVTKQITIPGKGSGSGQPGEASGKSGAPECPYTALSFAALGGADIALLAAALGFILALGFAAVPLPALRRAAYIRPPLRAPPALI